MFLKKQQTTTRATRSYSSIICQHYHYHNTTNTLLAKTTKLIGIIIRKLEKRKDGDVMRNDSISFLWYCLNF